LHPSRTRSRPGGVHTNDHRPSPRLPRPRSRRPAPGTIGWLTCRRRVRHRSCCPNTRPYRCSSPRRCGSTPPIRRPRRRSRRLVRGLPNCLTTRYPEPQRRYRPSTRRFPPGPRRTREHNPTTSTRRGPNPPRLPGATDRSRMVRHARHPDPNTTRSHRCAARTRTCHPSSPAPRSTVLGLRPVWCGGPRCRHRPRQPSSLPNTRRSRRFVGCMNLRLPPRGSPSA